MEYILTGDASPNPALSPHEERLRKFPGVRMGTSATHQCRGLFATTAYKAGELILEEEAVCWQEEGGERAVYHLASLTPEALESVLFQMAPYGGGGGTELPSSKGSRKELVYNTMKANSFGSSGGSLRGLFPVLCLSNSSCDPCASAEEVAAYFVPLARAIEAAAVTIVPPLKCSA
jgi:hypothetical protein